MAQFSVYKNRNTRSSAQIPYLLDIQSDLLADLGTRVVVPLARPQAQAVISQLMPELVFEGQALIMLTPQLAGIARIELGAPLGELSAYRPVMLAALDLLIVGF